MNIKKHVFLVQAIFSAFVLVVCVPKFDDNSKYQSITLAVLGYWFPSPVGSLIEDNVEGNSEKG